MKSFFEAVTGVTQEEIISGLKNRGLEPDLDKVRVYPFAEPAYLVTQDGEKIILAKLKEVQP